MAIGTKTKIQSISNQNSVFVSFLINLRIIKATKTPTIQPIKDIHQFQIANICDKLFEKYSH